MQLLYQLSVSSIFLMALTPFVGPLIREMTPVIGMIFAVQVLLVVCVGFLSWFWVLSIYPASNMASFGFLAPLFGVAFGWLILNTGFFRSAKATFESLCEQAEAWAQSINPLPFELTPHRLDAPARRRVDDMLLALERSP